MKVFVGTPNIIQKADRIWNYNRMLDISKDILLCKKPTISTNVKYFFDIDIDGTVYKVEEKFREEWMRWIDNKDDSNASELPEFAQELDDCSISSIPIYFNPHFLDGNKRDDLPF